MALAVLAVIGGLVIGRLAGGRLSSLAELPLRDARLVAAAALLQLLGVFLPGPYPVWMMASLVPVGLFVVRNTHLPGLLLVATGLAANAAAVAANGAMPVSLYAATRAGVNVERLVDDPRHEPADHGTALRPLTDVIAFPLPVGAGVLSVGDAFVAAGAGLLVFSAMRLPAPTGRRRRQDVGGWGPTEGGHGGQEEAQGSGSQEEQGQPRQASQLLGPPSAGLPRP